MQVVEEGESKVALLVALQEVVEEAAEVQVLMAVVHP